MIKGAAKKAVQSAGEHAASQPNRPAAQDGGGGPAHAVLASMGEGFAKAIEVEKQVSAPIAAIPFPGLGAARVLDVIIGLPHAHSHPPNLVPPAPPVPLPSIGPIIPIPYLSGASTVSIEGGKAARCGDFGVSIWCGGYFPMIEIFTGSASVWIESARAARIGDVTKHCIFSKLSSADCPLGPPIGAVSQGAGTVKIGGAPMPSLVGLAMSGAMSVAGKAASAGKNALKGALFRAAGKSARSAEEVLERFLAHLKNLGDDVFKKEMLDDLRKMAGTKAGRELMDELVDLRQPLRSQSARALPECKGMSALQAAWHARAAADNVACQKPWVYDAAGDLVKGRNGPRIRLTADQGVPSGATVSYEPGVKVGQKSPSDVVLFHELTHARNMARGRLNQATRPDPEFQRLWKDIEEHATVAEENAYRKERGYPKRTSYGDL